MRAVSGKNADAQTPRLAGRRDGERAEVGCAASDPNGFGFIAQMQPMSVIGDDAAQLYATRRRGLPVLAFPTTTARRLRAPACLQLAVVLAGVGARGMVWYACSDEAVPTKPWRCTMNLGMHDE